MVAMAFETARLNSPSVIFFDEFQALFTERSKGVSSRLTSTLLSCMDDVKRWRSLSQSQDHSKARPSQGFQVVVIAATNTPWMVDKSFLRPGRFDRSVHVALPTLNERIDIFKMHLRRMMLQNTVELDGTCQRLAKLTVGWSGADIVSLARAAAVCCLMENTDVVEEKHFIQVLNDGLRPSSDKNLVERIAKWKSC